MTSFAINILFYKCAIDEKCVTTISVIRCTFVKSDEIIMSLFILYIYVMCDVYEHV